MGLGLLFFVFSINEILAQPTPPSIRCVSVESNGMVTLSWIAPTDTGTVFGGYHIYSSPGPSGPYAPVDSIFNYNTFTTTLTGVNASNTVLYFYIKTREGCCSNYSIASDTLRSIRMIVTPLSNEHVRLNWNRTHTPPLPTTSPLFSLSKELSAGIYTTFASLTDTTTQDTNYYCNKFINYRVTQGDASGCTSVSSIDGEVFKDTRGPAQPLIDTVSIDLLTGDAIISWFPDSSTDTQGYVIYQFNGTSYDSIGAVSGINSLIYINSLTNSDQVVETYTVAAFDSCKNLSSLATNHVTMLLSASFSKCDAELTLDWTPYINMAGGLSRYEIWIRENSGAWILDGFVPPVTTNYIKTLTNPGATYDFFIRAVGNTGKKATSNMKSAIADIFIQPEFLYIRSASVNGSEVEITCFVDAMSEAKAYVLYHSESPTGLFKQIDFRNYTPSANINFTHAFANADLRPQYYKVAARDSCGKEFVQSNMAGTVFLSAQGGNDYTSTLNWTNYIGWQYPPGSYKIYRVTNGIPSGTPFATVSGDTLFFQEDVSDLPVPDGNICYLIRASEDSVNLYGFSDEANSNIACAPQAPSVFVPNAFTPGGKNPLFVPYVLFENPDDYSFQVFNRWGQIVYHSESSGEGWNGTFNGKDAPSGLYVYRLIFKGLNKKEVRRFGTVSLIR